MGKPGNTGIKRINNATGITMRGLYAAFKHEAAFRQEVALCAVLAPLAIWLGDTAVEKSLMIGSLMLVLIVELFNSAVEAVVDRVSNEQHELSGRAKDIGSAAVFISLANVTVIWALIIIW